MFMHILCIFICRKYTDYLGRGIDHSHRSETILRHPTTNATTKYLINLKINKATKNDQKR